MALFRSGTTKQSIASASLVVLVFLLVVFPASGVQADDPPQGYWELTETLVNPANAPTDFYGGGQTPGYFEEPRFEGKHTLYSVSRTSFGIDDREVDHGYEYHNVSFEASFQEPPDQLIRGQTV